MGQGDRTCPTPIFMKGGTFMVMSPNILEVMSSRLSLFHPVTATTVVCSILTQILCVVSQKSFSFCLPDSLPGLRPWTPLRHFCPPDLQSSFMSPNNSARSTPLVYRTGSVKMRKTRHKVYPVDVRIFFTARKMGD